MRIEPSSQTEKQIRNWIPTSVGMMKSSSFTLLYIHTVTGTPLRLGASSAFPLDYLIT